MGNSKTQPLSKEQLEALYRSNVRQRARAGLGTVISSGMAGSGLIYMAAPAVVAAYGHDKAETARDQLQDIMKAHGLRVRKRDKLAGALVGSAEKLTLTFLLLGHDELAYLGETYELDPKVLQAHTDWLTAGGDGVLLTADGTPAVNDKGQILLDRGIVGDGNGVYNVLVDGIKTDFDVTPGLPETGEQAGGAVLAGAAAAAIEHTTNQAGHVGRVIRAKSDMPGAFVEEDGKSMREKLGI